MTVSTPWGGQAEELKAQINGAAYHLSDQEAIDMLEEIASYCEIVADAIKEDMRHESEPGGDE